MSTFVLVPGAGGNASYWRELVAELERRGREAIPVFSHGRAHELEGDELAEVDRSWTAHYGSSPLSWGDVVMYRLDPSWMVGYASTRDELLAERGVTL